MHYHDEISRKWQNLDDNLSILDISTFDLIWLKTQKPQNVYNHVENTMEWLEINDSLSISDISTFDLRWLETRKP